MTFEDSVEKNLLQCLSAAGGRIRTADCDGVSLIVGLSGGTDSTALLLALSALRAKSRLPKAAGGGAVLGLELYACHVNHHLRGAESAADEQFCRELCLEHDIPLYTADLEDVGAAEAELRQARYDALLRLAKHLSAPYIVTAHNLDDQAETVLFRLLRGTSVRGLTGMALARPLEDAPWPTLLRPMIKIGRREISLYLLEKGVTARFDSSNSDLRYSRNFLRQEILLPLKERFPAALNNLENFRSTLQVENDYLSERAAELYSRAVGGPNELRLEALTGEHEALVGRVLATYIESAGILPSYGKVKRCLALVREAQNAGSGIFSGRLSLGENFELLVDKNCILLKPLYELEATGDEYLARMEAMVPVPIKMPRTGRSSALTLVPWLNFAVSVEDASAAAGASAEDRPRSLDRSTLAVLVDLKEISSSELVLRPRRPGDRLQPLGMSGPVRLKQYLHANKALFARARRILPGLNEIMALRLFPVLANGDEVLWVPGFGLSAKIRAADGAASHLITLLPLDHGDIDGDTHGESVATC